MNLKANLQLINHDSIICITTNITQYLPDRGPHPKTVAETLPYTRAITVRQSDHAYGSSAVHPQIA